MEKGEDARSDSEELSSYRRDQEDTVGLLQNRGRNSVRNRWINKMPYARFWDALNGIQGAIHELENVARSNVLSKLLLVVSIFLDPSFLRHSNHGRAEKSTSNIASLDGLRGVASFAVFLHHFLDSWIYPKFYHGYGSGDENMSWYQLPFITGFINGHGAVMIFFTLSGVVLSKRPIQLIRQRNREAGRLESLLTSMVFRRGFRLFIPTFFSMGVAFLLLRMRAFEPGRDIFDNHKELHTATEQPPPLLGGFSAQFCHYIGECLKMSSAWAGM